MIRLTDKTFHYTSSVESAKPNYLKNKFDKIRRELREAAAKREAESEANSVEAAVKVFVIRERMK